MAAMFYAAGLILASIMAYKHANFKLPATDIN